MTGSVVVEKPPQEVFDYLIQIARHGEWSPKPWSVEADPGPLSLGTTWRSHGWVPGDKDHLNEAEVTEFTPPSRISWAATEKEGLFVSTYVLTSEGSGTRVDRTFEFPEVKGFVRVMFPVISALIVKPNFDKGLKLFKEKLEA